MAGNLVPDPAWREFRVRMNVPLRDRMAGPCYDQYRVCWVSCLEPISKYPAWFTHAKSPRARHTSMREAYSARLPLPRKWERE